MQPFHDWLGNRAQEAPAAENLATLIASAGAAGISHGRLRTLVPLSPETLQEIIRSLVATGQVVVLKVNGQMVFYRATM
ncbi:MAG: hypothetical protein ACLQNE_25210 [Thermoguttaceae bacterium]|jgi:NADH:ubiquinone oxidoreductase subunit 4 (subunit M)